MNYFTPLQPGDEIRVVAPSASKRPKDLTTCARAARRLEALGYKISFGKSISQRVRLGSALPSDRAADLADAYSDTNVKAIMALTGGWLANEILPLIDWKTVSRNPKPLIGYSDITVLLNAIYAKTGTVNFLGPNFGTIGYKPEWQYSLENLNDLLTGKFPKQLIRSRSWGERRDRTLRKTKPWQVLTSGIAEGILLGGNLGTLYLLQGTEWMPKFNEPFILAAEDDDETGKFTGLEFSRRLESLLQQPGFRTNLQGILIGRFQPTSGVRLKDLRTILDSKDLGPIPIIAEVDFGHTLPMFTLPIGGYVAIDAKKGNNPRVTIDIRSEE